MDRKYIQEQDVVDRYLQHKLTDQEQRDFLFLMMQDETLREEVEDARLVVKTLKKVKKHRLSARSNTSNWIKWTLLLGVLLVSVFIFYPNQNASPDQNQIEFEPIQKEKNNLIPSIEEPQSIEEKTILNPPIKEPSEAKKAPAKKAPKKTVKKPVLIAAYTPNPSLESWISNNYRSNEYEFSLEQPISNKKFKLKQNSVELNFKGTLSSTEEEIIAYFQLHLFNNNEQAYRNFEPVESWDMDFEEREGQWNFSIKEKRDLQPGLYYYLIRDEDTGMKYFAGKFTVVN